MLLTNIDVLYSVVTRRQKDLLPDTYASSGVLDDRNLVGMLMGSRIRIRCHGILVVIFVHYLSYIRGLRPGYQVYGRVCESRYHGEPNAGIIFAS